MNMKKILSCFILAIILTCPLLTTAQRVNSAWLSADLGGNNAMILNQNAYGNPEMAYSPKFNISGSLTFNKFLQQYGYSAGFGIGHLGQNYSGDMAGAPAERRIKLTYLQVPVLGMYYLNGYTQNKWVSFGLQFMYLLAAKQEFDRQEGGRVLPNEALLKTNDNVMSYYQPYDVMLKLEYTNVYSMGLSHKLKALLSLKSAVGLTDINAKGYRVENIIQKTYGGSHNFYLGLHVGIMYNINKKSAYNLIKPFNR